MGEGDFSLVFFSKGGDEEKVVFPPCGHVGPVRGGALLDGQGLQDAAQDHHGQALGLEVQEEDTEGLIGGQGPKLEYLLDLDGCFRVEAEFFGFVFEHEFVEIIAFDGPPEVLAEVFDEGWEGVDLAEAFGIGEAHGAVP